MTANEAFEIYAALLLVSTRNKQIEVGRWANHIEPILGNHELSSITSLKILLFEKHLIGKKQAPQSIHHCLSLLRRVLNRACEWELYPGPVPKFHMPKFDNRRIRFLSPTEAEAVLLDLKSRSELWHDLALFALSTGLRKGELLALTPSQINLSANLCSVLDSKSGKGRSVPLHPEALKVAQKYLKQPSATLFTDNGHRINPHSKHFHNAVKACGLNHGVMDRRARVCFHTLRHTFASWLVQAGTPLSLVGQFLGHSNYEMTLRYAHLAPGQGQKAILQLPLMKSRMSDCLKVVNS